MWLSECLEKKAVRQLMQELPPLRLVKHSGEGARADTCVRSESCGSSDCLI